MDSKYIITFWNQRNLEDFVAPNLRGYPFIYKVLNMWHVIIIGVFYWRHHESISSPPDSSSEVHEDNIRLARHCLGARGLPHLISWIIQNGGSAIILACNSGHQFDTFCEKLKVMGRTLTIWDRPIFVPSLCTPIQVKRRKMFGNSLKRNRVLDQIADKKCQNTYDDESSKELPRTFKILFFPC